MFRILKDTSVSALDIDVVCRSKKVSTVLRLLKSQVEETMKSAKLQIELADAHKRIQELESQLQAPTDWKGDAIKMKAEGLTNAKIAVQTGKGTATIQRYLATDEAKALVKQSS
ncbi:hypothetical protein L2735_14075 [Shewanella olleyana]|uniref:hypothetical protein n=1 Tax=Shewanella olleyana TaxID=135626 RepID=UPI00200C9C8D|nr:hypothetical protein [Shewanella olleyana]MCL1067918.1 hypothetical protein [Shewanella olleyana]